MNKLLIVLFSAVLALCAHAGVAGKFFAYRSFWPETEAMKQFADIGVNLYAVMPSNSFNSLGEPYCKFPPFWVWDETYLWENVDAKYTRSNTGGGHWEIKRNIKNSWIINYKDMWEG